MTYCRVLSDLVVYASKGVNAWKQLKKEEDTLVTHERQIS